MTATKIVVPTMVWSLLIVGCGSEAVRKARDYASVKEYERAREVLELDLQSNPRNLEAYLLLGEVNLLVGAEPEAEEAFEKAILVKEKSRGRVAEIYFKAGQELLEDEELAMEERAAGSGYLKKSVTYDPGMGKPAAALLKDIVLQLPLPEEERPARYFLEQAFQWDPDLMDEEDLAWLEIQISDDTREAIDAYLERFPEAESSPEKALVLNQIRQKLTINDMRNLGTAFLSWLTDQVGAASAGQRVYDLSSLGDPEETTLSAEELYEFLHPSDTFFYIRDVPRFDGWGHPFEFRLNPNFLVAQQVMMIRSPGSDGVFTGERYEVGSFDPSDFAEDLVWTDGYFVRWAEGMRR